MTDTATIPEPATDDCRAYSPPAVVRRLTWEEIAEQRPQMSRKVFRLHLSRLSLSDQIQMWNRLGELHPTYYQQAEAAVDAITDRVERIQRITPGGGWDDHYEHLPAELGGGEFPPGGRDTLMKRARGERRHYPPQYLTTSGHSFDVYVQDVYLNRVQALLDEDDEYDDGYRGGVIHIHDLPPAERKRFRKPHNGKHGASNTMDFDGIPD